MSSLHRRIFALLGVVGAGCGGSVLDTAQKGGMYDAIDADGDGETAATDCNDHDPFVYTGAPEDCNDRDDDCDNEVDEGIREVFYLDADGDGFGNPEASTESCFLPEGYVANAEDCDDGSDAAFPGGTEICDGRDNDCDGDLDEVIGYFPDADGDGFGWPSGGIPSCGPLPSGYADNTSDCDDTDPEVNPDAVELCLDNLDNDCDGLKSCVVATLTDGSGGDCTLHWALRSAETTDWTYPCPGCDFSFAATAQLELALGEGPACVDFDPSWRSVSVADESLRMGGGLFVESWAGAGAWDEDRLLVGSAAYDLGSALGQLVYGAEVFAYEVSYYYGYEGRPFSVQGSHRLAPVVAGGRWAAPLELGGTDAAALCQQAGRAWLRAARSEHAAVASFARFSLDLMRLGAPPELLRASARAAADEVEHARAAFSIAGALLGRDLGPGPLDTRGGFDDSDVLAVFLRLLHEGCVDETVSAALAAEMRSEAREPAVQGVLDRIIRDEGEHALLAWRAARWMLADRPWLVTGVREVLGALAAEQAPECEGRNPAELRSLGVLHRDRRQAVRVAVLQRTVVPGLEALIAGAQPCTGDGVELRS